MKISWNWLKKLVDLKDTTQSELAERLILAGFEIENIINQKHIQDIIIEISTTANRTDIISMASIAIEIASISHLNLKLYKQIPLYNSKIIYKKIKNLDNFNQYTTLYYSIITNISLNESPKWLKDHLIASDINTKNNIMDIINFINFKWGQSIKVFQIENSKNNYTKTNHQINDNKPISWNKIQESIIKLNSTDTSDYYTNPINLIIIGYINKNHKINNQHNKQNIKSKKHLSYAIIEILHLIEITYKQKNNKKVIYKHENTVKNENNIICRIEYIHKILGPIKQNKRITYLDKTTIINILQKLNFIVKDYSKTLKVIIPEERENDIQQEIDIVEEIGRIYGFNNFINHLPKINQIGHLSANQLVIKKIRQILRSISLHEVINYSLRPKHNLISNHIELINPLNKEQKALRTNLIEGLIESKFHNINQVNENFEVFEIGKIFINENKLFIKDNERLHLGCILGNNDFCRSKWHETPNELSWFQAKGNIEEFLERMHIKFTWSTNSKKTPLLKNIQQYIHPTRTIYIKYKNQTIGIFSQLNNRLTKKLGLYYKIYIFEIDISNLIKTKTTINHLTCLYKPYSNYPKITRDISIQINKYVTIQRIKKIMQAIKQEENEILESITIFDEYYETNQTKRIGLRTTYRSKDTTLTNKKIEKIENVFKDKLYTELLLSKS
uniref:phenylalanine tRNA synthetase n=1 Tax=Synarthrophyton patena TaxID=48972 RepID=UPI0021823AE5|nr:phenylalanine tRNA synthetase [Synarthrophyton patena]UVF62857.1 phenylalanine tRNA synthetase [Synarthrophyton patena]